MKFNVLDDLKLWQRTLLLLLCAGSCCWGFVNNTILLVFAGKIGFPIAVAACAMSVHPRYILSVFYYTVLLVATGTGYFAFNEQYVLSNELTKNFVPSWTDFVLAIGIGWALSHFWHHPIRINIIILSAGLTSLLPACIMAGYQLAHGNLYLVVDSLYLYGQYVFGMLAGSILDKRNYNGELDDFTR
jgi:hypothetical protein